MLIDGVVAMAETNQFCTFYLGEYYFAVEVRSVQEVMRYQTMTRVPLAPATVRGLINLRGQIVTAIDLRQRLGMPARSDETRSNNVVVRVEDGAPVSLLVDEIGDVVEVPQDLFEQPPDTMDDVTRELVTGVYKLDDKLLLVLDIHRALSVDTVAVTA